MQSDRPILMNRSNKPVGPIRTKFWLDRMIKYCDEANKPKEHISKSMAELVREIRTNII